ncbi:MAG: nucleotidyltransferase family protein [Pseudomonadota bacterium]
MDDAGQADRTVTHAMVLAAGLGTRMRHLSADRPKPLVEVAGRTLLDRVLDRVAEAGIPTAVVNIHYMADAIEAALSDRTRPRIVFSDERDVLLETGGGIRRALPLLGPGPFLVQNSDCLWSERGNNNLKRLIGAWGGNRMDALLLVTPTETCLGYDGRGDFVMDAAGRLSRRAAAATAPLVFTGASIAHPRLFDETPDGAFSLNVVWDRAIAAGRVFGVVMEGVWMHVGTPEAVAEAEDRLRND